MLPSGIDEPYVKFRLGNEKYKTRSSTSFTSNGNHKWLEQFDLHLYDDGDQQLEITIWQHGFKTAKRKKTKDEQLIGRCVVDLSEMKREVTHNLWQQLDEMIGSGSGEGGGKVHLLLTISGTTASETISDLGAYEENERELQGVQDRYVC